MCQLAWLAGYFCLCLYRQTGNPEWDFLLNLDMDILSMDVYLNGEIFSTYAGSINRFLDNGSLIAWGIVPTNFDPFEAETIDTLTAQLENVWNILAKKGIEKEYLLSKSLICPARAAWSLRTAKKQLKKPLRLSVKFPAGCAKNTNQRPPAELGV